MRSEVRFFPGPFFYESRDTSDDFDPGDVAQLGERWLCKPEVAGSIPVVSIKIRLKRILMPRRSPDVVYRDEDGHYFVVVVIG